MKQFWMKNKVLIATLCAVLALGIVFWGGLRLFEGNQMQDALIRTAAAEAEATSTPAPGEMPAIRSLALTRLQAVRLSINANTRIKEICFKYFTLVASFGDVVILYHHRKTKSIWLENPHQIPCYFATRGVK